MKQSIDVAAYIWPAYTGLEPRTRMFWPDGIGEWQTVQKADAKFEGHLWPRKPLMGYGDEATPEVMEQQIDLAVSHGVNVFAYDWYWFDRRPFLEQCLNDGFLKAPNHDKMKFYLMWANHDAMYLWDKRLSDLDNKTVIWQGTIVPQDWLVISRRWLDQYFTLPCYYKVDGKPLIAIYDIRNFVDSFGGIDGTKSAMEQLDELARREYGLPGVHFQLVYHNANASNLSGIDSTGNTDNLAFRLPFASVTHYQYVHFTNVDREYDDAAKDVVKEWQRIEKEVPFPYYPHVSIGWDNNPRFFELHPNILRNNTPEAFEKMLRCAKEDAQKHAAPMVTINSWNEWTEGSYLLPDDLYGYGYLDAIKRVFTEE